VSLWFRRSYERVLQRDTNVGTGTLGAPVASRDWGAFAGLEDVMTNGSGRLVIRCAIAILTTAISIGAMDSAFAQSRIGQIGRDGLTNRHESPSSETESFRLEM
jgi:hypothetical protein